MSDELKIERSNDSPFIQFNKSNGVLTISGRSLPEDAFLFYSPIIDWLTQYAKSPAQNTFLNINLEYFNTASAKQIYKIITIAGELRKDNTLTVKWHYDDGDVDMQSSGERFSKLSGVPFELIKN